MLSIPDWSVTPYAETRREAIALAIDAFNRINRQETEERGASYIDVTPTSRQAAQDLSLIAPDGLHPHGENVRRMGETGSASRPAGAQSQ